MTTTTTEAEEIAKTTKSDPGSFVVRPSNRIFLVISSLSLET
ncbi:MAG TPA: hypothetical protein VJ729_09435 [Nitrososphaeraceae archaeon]|nr:hypothetical protein [Nitrososphaeraceae archaeon]